MLSSLTPLFVVFGIMVTDFGISGLLLQILQMAALDGASHHRQRLSAGSQV